MEEYTKLLDLYGCTYSDKTDSSSLSSQFHSNGYQGWSIEEWKVTIRKTTPSFLMLSLQTSSFGCCGGAYV